MTERYHDLIHDEEELRRFVEEILYPLEQQEVFFVSCSARNKYLTPEERQELALGRTEMFQRQLIREHSYERFEKILQRMSCHHLGYRTKNGSSIPAKCMVVYLNINPTDMLAAQQAYAQDVARVNNEIMRRAMAGQDFSDLMREVRKFDLVFMKHAQQQRGSKHFIDVDFDIPLNRFDLVESFHDQLTKNGVRFWTVCTHGGYHVLIDRHTLNFNFHLRVQELNDALSQLGIEGEVVVNKNEMIPLPGTLQAGTPVKLL